MGHEMNALRVHIAQRNAQLDAIAGELKCELYGIDHAIDRVIDSVRAWFVLPEIISRPVIVCLWGLTGTGKTRLAVRWHASWAFTIDSLKYRWTASATTSEAVATPFQAC